MPAKNVKAYVKGNKNDAADAAAICEAVRRRTMQCAGKIGRAAGPADAASNTRSSIAATDQVINALRAHMAELGIVAAQGREGLKQLLAIIADEKEARLPIDARTSLTVVAAQLQALHTLIGSIEKRLIVQHRANEASKRLETIHGIGVMARALFAPLSRIPVGTRGASSVVAHSVFSMLDLSTSYGPGGFVKVRSYPVRPRPLSLRQRQRCGQAAV